MAKNSQLHAFRAAAVGPGAASDVCGLDLSRERRRAVLPVFILFLSAFLFLDAVG